LKAYIQEHHLANGVTLTGAVDNVHQYLQASDIFVFPSKYEGFGLSIAEAMSCGLPSVVSNVGIAVDLIQNYKTAVLFEPGVDTQLLAGMEWVLDHRDVWQDMGTLARDEIVTRYGMDAVAAAYMAMFSAISPYCAAGTNYSVGANRG
jgi:glycosyltransferase involved in cell wall biosynthesis